MADLKLKVTVDTTGIAKLAEKIKDLQDRIAKEQDDSAKALQSQREKAYTKMYALQRASVAREDALDKERVAHVDRTEKQKIALQRASLALEDKMERQRAADMERNSRNSLRVTQTSAQATARIERQAAIAESALVLNRFDRRIAVERTKHIQILEGVKNNDAAVEAELRRFNAVIGRIQMDKSASNGNLLSNIFKGVVGGNLATRGILEVTGAIRNFTTSSIEAALQGQRIQKTLEFATGSAAAGRQAFKEVSDEVDRLGLSLPVSAEGYAKLLAASKGTTMEGEKSLSLFRGVSEATATLGLSADETSGIILALTQMMSKGTVQAEELKNQLGERLVGSFKAAADASGGTTRQFMKMMEQGEIISTEFLPKFGDEMHKVFGESAKQAAEQGQAGLNRFNNESFRTAQILGRELLPPLLDVTKELGAMLRAGQKSGELQEAFHAMAVSAKITAESLAFTVKVSTGIAGGFRDIWRIATGQAVGYKRELEEAKKAADALATAPKKAADNGIAISDAPEPTKAALAAAKSAKAAAKAQEDAQADLRNKVLASQRELQAKIRAAAKREQDEAVAADERHTEQIYAARSRLALAQAKGPMEELKAKQTAELESLEGNEAAKTLVLKAQLLERKALDDVIAKEKIDNEKRIRQQSLQTLATMSGNLHATAQQFKVFAPTYKAFAQFQNAIATRAAAIEAYKAGSAIPIFGVVAGPTAAAAAIAYGVANAAKIDSEQFYAGGYTGPGNPMDVAGIVHRDEYVVPHDTLNRIGGPAGVENRLSGGGGGVTHTGDVNIVIQAAPGTTPAQAQELGAAAQRGYRDELKRWKRLQRDADYYGVTA